MPELLTRGELCGLGLEDCPNGRLQIGTLSGFISERRPASRRNTRPDKIGIYSQTVIAEMPPSIRRISVEVTRSLSSDGGPVLAANPV